MNQERRDTPSLSPCPFCGGGAATFSTELGHVIHCDNNQCIVYANVEEPTFADAAAAWNRRIGVPSAEGALSTLRELVRLKDIKGLLDDNDSGVKSLRADVWAAMAGDYKENKPKAWAAARAVLAGAVVPSATAECIVRCEKYLHGEAIGSICGLRKLERENATNNTADSRSAK